MQQFQCKYFIFSSTAAVFGTPEKVPIEAADRKGPINPYGDTKLAVENILRWCDSAYGLKSVCLRYFNACGADAAGNSILFAGTFVGDLGEDHEPESHLIPIVLQVPAGKREKVSIFGNNYKTPDGTCVRDYVHVTDLATAHIKALEFMIKHKKSEHFNLGSGEGYSVLEIIEAARRVTGHSIPATIQERFSFYIWLISRRAGDPDMLVACSKKAEDVLGWKRKYDNIDDIVRSAWNFHKSRPNGYGTQQN
jgi:UDP-glucose 4-epimerase